MQDADLATPASPVPAIVLPVVPKYLLGELEPLLLKESHIQADRGVSSAGSQDGLPWVLTTLGACYPSTPLSEASPQNTGAPGDPLLQTSGPTPSLSRWGSACRRPYPKLGKAGIGTHVLSLVLRPLLNTQSWALANYPGGGPSPRG